MTASDIFETDLAKMIFNASTSVVFSSTMLYISLHTAAPGDAGSQITSETTYTGYTRIGVSKVGTTGFTVAGDLAYNTTTITFPQCTGGSGTITHFGIGCSSGTSTGYLVFDSSITTALAVSSGVTPSFASTALQVSIA
jgi:hypothetical protein